MDVGISGMALGADTWWAMALVDYGVPLHSYVPFPRQSSPWTDADKAVYTSLLAAADKVVTVCDKYHPWAFQKRNEAMVDALVDDEDCLLACWTGKESGGTWNCIRYARRQGKHIYYVNPETHEIRF